MAYGTLSVLKAYYLGNMTSTTDDGALTSLLANAQAIVDAYTGRTFEAASDSTKYFDAIDDVDGRTLHLGNKDLCAITSITNGDGVALPAAQYVTEPRNSTPYYAITIRSNSTYYWTESSSNGPENAIAIVGRWAYSTSAPVDVAQATYRLAAFLYRQNDAQIFDMTGTSELGQITIAHRIPADVREVLAPYRRRI